MSNLESRWVDDPQYQFILRSVKDHEIQPVGMTWREWYATAPKASHPTLGELLDMRGLHLKNEQIGKAEFDAVLDGSTLRACTFSRTVFVHASAADCDFTGSRFIVAQMSPIYAPEAIFKDCVFESCFLMGIGPRNYSKGAFSDLKRCDFSGVHANKTSFNRCDFRGAKLSRARFTHCEFFEADLRGVDLKGVQFEGCEFGNAQIDDTPDARAVVLGGDNLEFDSIQWAIPHPHSYDLRNKEKPR